MNPNKVYELKPARPGDLKKNQLHHEMRELV
jgi:hypothetical protein